MKTTVFVRAALLAPAIALFAQLPLPAALLQDGRVVYVGTAGGVERGLLDRAANEITKEGIFTLTGDRSTADLIFTVSPGREGDTVIVPVAGLFVAASTDSYRLLVQDPSTDEVLWDDSREAHWMHSGAILDLVKDLHKAIRQEHSRQ